jgi:hypothetical protein
VTGTCAKYCENSARLNKDGHKKNWFHLDRFYEDNDDLTSDNLDVAMETTRQNMNYVVEGKATYGKNSHYRT